MSGNPRKMLILLLFDCLLLSLSDYTQAQLLETLNARGCGKDKSCWFAPENCQNTNQGEDCDIVVQWVRGSDGQSLQIALQGKMKYPDGNSFNKNFQGFYIALAFSYDGFMGDDSVVECVRRPSGEGQVYMSFNDGSANVRLQNASKAMISQARFRTDGNKFTCLFDRLIKPPPGLIESSGRPKTAKFMAFDLDENEYVFQIARGAAHPLTDNLFMHPLSDENDGQLYPWVAKSSVSFRPDTSASIVEGAKHYDIARSVQYQMVVSHGILMVFGWWVFGALGMIISRYFKPMYPSKKLCGLAVWFQLHRDIMIISIVLQCAAFILIFVQAGDFKLCTFRCDDKDYALFLHTILGVICTGMAIIQPFLAWIRPQGDSKKRPIFNWIHWLLGQSSFTLATIVIFLSPMLGKGGLRRNYDLLPYHLMGGYIGGYILVNVLLEILVSCTEKFKEKSIGQSDLALKDFGPAAAKYPVNKPITSQPKWGIFRAILLALFALFAIAVCGVISALIKGNLDHH